MTGLLQNFFSNKRSRKRKRSSSTRRNTMKHSIMNVIPTVTRRNGNYHSEQTHAQFVNGVTEERQQIVDIRGNKGTKTVIVTQNGTIKESVKPLSAKEIVCIRKCQFMPELFKSCDKCIR